MNNLNALRCECTGELDTAVVGTLEIVGSDGRKWLESLTVTCEACSRSWELLRPVQCLDEDSPYEGEELIVDDDLEITPDDATAIDLAAYSTLWGDPE